MNMRVLPVVEIVTAGHDDGYCDPKCPFLRSWEGMCTLFGERMERTAVTSNYIRPNACHDAERNYDSMDGDTQDRLRKRD